MSKHARVLNDSEREMLFSYIDTMKYASRNRLIMVLTHYAGMRVGEIAGLLHNDLLIHSGEVSQHCIGLAENPLSVVVGNNRYVIAKQIQLKRRNVKGNHARSVVLSSTVRDEIVKYYSGVSGVELGECVVINRFRNPMTNQRLAQEIKRWYADCGLHGCSSHSGRRGFVTNLLDKQVNIRVVQQLVGHRQLSTTQLYADTRDSMLREAVEML